ncbi:hypothetical protein BDV97DRAFT_354760 [Delphinella strobiligena]|nr:hypothetical protein BDV97DRAFT_354760 [Delphinella strobiligena]
MLETSFQNFHHITGVSGHFSFQILSLCVLSCLKVVLCLLPVAFRVYNQAHVLTTGRLGGNTLTALTLRHGLSDQKLTSSQNLDHLSMDRKPSYLPDELWEKILLHLYPRDLITKQGICQQVKNVIQGTPSLRRLLFIPAQPRQINDSVIRTILYRSSNRHTCIHETNQKSLGKLWTVGFSATKRSTWALRVLGQRSTDEFWTSSLFLRLQEDAIASNAFNSQHSIPSLGRTSSPRFNHLFWTVFYGKHHTPFTVLHKFRHTQCIRTMVPYRKHAVPNHLGSAHDASWRQMHISHPPSLHVAFISTTEDACSRSGATHFLVSVYNEKGVTLGDLANALSPTTQLNDVGTAATDGDDGTLDLTSIRAAVPDI